MIPQNPPAPPAATPAVVSKRITIEEQNGQMVWKFEGFANDLEALGTLNYALHVIMSNIYHRPAGAAPQPALQQQPVEGSPNGRPLRRSRQR